MPTTDGNKPTGKSRQRNRKAERNRKSVQPHPTPDPTEQIGATAASADASPLEAAAPTDAAPLEAIASPDVSPVEAVAVIDSSTNDATPASENAPVNFKTIANAYGDYTLKSLEEAKSYVEKLTGAGSLDKAVAIQTEFAKQACETFVAESQKISELHREMTRRMFEPLASLIARTTRTPR